MRTFKIKEVHKNNRVKTKDKGESKDRTDNCFMEGGGGGVRETD